MATHRLVISVKTTLSTVLFVSTYILILLQYVISVLYHHSQVLHETALVETFNLKAAIEYQLKNCK